jgi:tRNA(Ile)-lysidine synthase
LKVEDSVRHFIAKERLLATNARHLVALSGGADSVALLLILKRLGYQLEAVHCNFRLRGEESDRDENFVRELCNKEDVQLHLIHFDTETYASVHQVSIEMAARELRYRYFEQLRQDIGAEEVCVAHHQDDAVETLLMNLVRGTGIHGLTGIRPRNGHVVRPLLCVNRMEIEAYLHALGQPFVTDSTNLVPDVVRNKLRLQVLPLLRDINPAASANIAKTARRMADVETLYDLTVQRMANEVTSDGVVDVEALLQLPAPESVLYELLMPKGFTSAQVEQVFGCLTGQSGREFSSATHEAVVDRGRLIVEERREAMSTMKIPETGTYQYAENQKVRFCEKAEVSVSKQADRATLDAEKVRFPLTVRPVQQGDRFQPFGMEGSRLVSDYLTDRKYSVFKKRRQLVVADANGTIVWLVSERVDQRFAVSAATQRVLEIQLLKE